MNKVQKRIVRYLLIGVGVIAILVGSVWAYLFLSSPVSVRLPKMEHAHFRMQIIVEGKKEDFAEAKYQQTYEKGVCSAELSNEPIHFHDAKDQVVHLHWKGVTGGDVLKYYGWNLAGGRADILGYRFDRSPIPEAVPIHGADLPAIPTGTKLWVYAGSQEKYDQRILADFLGKDVEEFFGRKSTVNTDMALDPQNFFAPTAYAHDGHDHGDAKTPAQLEDINNLLGNVVIFVQRDEPSDEAVKERFNALEPLTDSTCGG